MRKITLLLIAVGITLVLPTQGWAYIDPGTGMSFVSGIGAFLLGFLALVFGTVALTFKRLWAWTKSAVVRLRARFGAKRTL